ncbi:error-prone DNA polymerase [Niveibacterium sp. COAC-50]|uniref:error-prone DNA polymerase n=1 Tax=Niveibacterium sp. COAC-50 TaxID=2729384 RepID=UPI0015522196|nr:error-prone DNA polymerase [Niveibacterium sp. COAC-50]
MKPLPAYAELHCISNFTFLRGASHPEELVERAYRLGYTALAITDECSFAGAVRAFDAWRQLREAAGGDFDFRLIHGAEFRFECGLKLVLLAKNRAGYGNLAALITLGRRRAEKGEYRLVRGDLESVSPSGAVPDCFALWVPDERLSVEDGRWLAQRFPGRIWLAVELHSGPDDAARLAALQALAEACGMPCVASGDVHMHARLRRPLQDVLTAIRLNTTVFEAGDKLYPNAERHLRQPLRLSRLYPAAMLEESARIAAQCNFTLDELRYEYPDEIVPNGETPTSYLRRETFAGLARRYPDGVPEMVLGDVENELALIAELKYEPFFLTVYDIVCFAKREGILCQGRGSAANSIVCYALGITEVDPTRAFLLFGRFMSRERDEPPDIDVDFEHERREIVIQYIYRKYTRERAALAATLIRYRTKGALRDAGRALGFGIEQIDALSGSLAWWDKREHLPERLAEIGLDAKSPRVSKWLALTNMLLGFPRHLSQHVGGFVISQGPLARLVPVENAAMPDRSVIQWDKEDLETLGLLKVDVLALGMLTALKRSLDLVSQRRGRPFALQDIPPKDAATFEMLCHADSVGVFQVESRAQMSMLPRLKPRTYYDLVVQVAIVRPGPIQGDMVHPYLAYRADPAMAQAAMNRLPKEVADVLTRTCGVPIFQEQVMKLAEVAAGFTPGEADQLRRAMASWRHKGHIDRFKDKLRAGMAAKGHPPEFAEALCRQIEGFGDYGFPESHAASFALLAYSSAWMKRHEPEAFLCGLLNSQPMGFYAPSQLVQDARRHGVQVLPVDVMKSGWESGFEYLPGARRPGVRLGLREIRGYPQAAAARVVAARERGAFSCVDDLAHRAMQGARELELLAGAGALKPLAGHRRQAAWQVSGVQRQGDLFDSAPPAEVPVQFAAPREGEEIVADFAATGLSLGRHPLALLRDRLSARRFLAASTIREMQHRALVRAAGIVIGRQRPGTARGVIFVTLEDETGQANIVVYADLSERQRRELLGARLLGVYGQLQREGEVVHVLAKRLVDLTPWLGALPTASRDFH